MNKRATLKENVSYMRFRSSLIENEVQNIRLYGKMKVNFLIPAWIKKELELRYYSLNDLAEIAVKAFRLTQAQAINLIYEQLPKTEEDLCDL